MAGRRVLVADDDEMTRRVLSTVLDLEEYEVTMVPDGDAAVESALAAPPDAAVLDQMMPGRTGLEVLEVLRADERTASLPVVLLTGLDATALGVDPLAAGADAYLTKPFSPLHLIEVLEDLMAGREVSR